MRGVRRDRKQAISGFCQPPKRSESRAQKSLVKPAANLAHKASRKSSSTNRRQRELQKNRRVLASSFCDPGESFQKYEKICRERAKGEKRRRSVDGHKRSVPGCYVLRHWVPRVGGAVREEGSARPVHKEGDPILRPPSPPPTVLPDPTLSFSRLLLQHEASLKQQVPLRPFFSWLARVYRAAFCCRCRYCGWARCSLGARFPFLEKFRGLCSTSRGVRARASLSSDILVRGCRKTTRKGGGGDK